MKTVVPFDSVEQLILSDLIAAAHARWKQSVTEHTLEDLKGQLDAAKSTLSVAISGTRTPSLRLLLGLHRELVVDRQDDHPDSDLALWLVKWLEAHARATAAGAEVNRTDGDRLMAAIERITASLGRAPGPLPPGMYRSLVHFPGRFTRLIVITGDRREEEPDSPADCFVRHAAITDPTTAALLLPNVLKDFLSDKALADDDVGDRGLGESDLLVIGGPNVNLASRLINPVSLFRFNVAPEWHEWDRRFRSLDELKPSNEGFLRAFWAVVESVTDRGEQPGTKKLPDIDIKAARAQLSDEGQRHLDRAEDLARQVLAKPLRGLGLYTAEQIVAQFAVPGYHDPITGDVQGRRHEEDRDVAVVSLAANPFAPPDSDRVAILVGGTHGPATAHAVRVLSERPDAFEQRPFGGVLEVRISAHSNWASKDFSALDFEWITPEYKPEQILENFEEARSYPERRFGTFAQLTDDELDGCISLVRRLAGDALPSAPEDGLEAGPEAKPEPEPG